MGEEMKNRDELSLDELGHVAGGAGGRNYITYMVVKGDCLNKIAKRYSVSVDDIVRWNKITNPQVLLVGTKLKIYTR